MDINDKIIEDVIVLLDGFNEEFVNHSNRWRWDYLTKKEKKEWVDNFARRHARAVILGHEV